MVLVTDWWSPMTYRHSLRLRIIISFCLFGAVLGTVFALVIWLSLDFIDDNLVDNRLAQELEYFTVQYRKHIQSPPPTSDHIKAYLGTESMPPDAKQLVSGISEGFHEIYHGETEYHIAVKTLPEHDEPLYLLYDVSALEFTEKRKLKIGIVLVGGAILLIGLGLWIGLLTSRKVIAPVAYLADQVNQSGPENLATDLSSSFYNDEVGVLAKALETAMQRVKAFVEREKQFTRDASHELRTPVAVIKGAVELLLKKQKNDDVTVNGPLQRIKRAVHSMENNIESLLWLAREEAAIDHDRNCNVVRVVEEAIAHLDHIFEEKPVEINFIAESNPVLAAPPPILQMVIVNLVQNALNHTTEGKITVKICNDCVTVSDTGSGIATCDLQKVTHPHVRGKSSHGFGLGLAIVKRLCNRFGWHLEIDSEIGQGTNVKLIFQPLRKSTTTRRQAVS
jgi:signal transduction histidine kinase